MPLKLLGKKSWNVYNQANIDRVHEDEEQARQIQQRDERTRRDNDASDMLDLLRQSSHADKRGIPLQQPDSHDGVRNSGNHHHHELRQPRKPPATQTSDRIPNSKIESAPNSGSSQSYSKQKSDDPLENISNVLFRDAAGRGQHGTTPWYSSLNVPVSTSTTTSPNTNTIGKDVWGNADPRRQIRDQTRLASSDPLLAMKRGVKQLKTVERQRDDWRAERERDLNEVEEMARRERQKRKGRKERQIEIDEGERARSRDGNKNQDRDRHSHRPVRSNADTERSRKFRHRHSHRSRSPDRHRTRS